MANSKTKNSWLKAKLGKINLGIRKFGETIGTPVREPIKTGIEGHYRQKKLDEEYERIMSRRKMKKAKEEYEKKYGKPYDWRTANPKDAKKMSEFLK